MEKEGGGCVALRCVVLELYVYIYVRAIDPNRSGAGGTDGPSDSTNKKHLQSKLSKGFHFQIAVIDDVLSTS